MLNIRIPEDPRKYKETILFGLTARQLICVAATLVICAPLYFLGRNYIPENIVSWLVIIIAIPLLSIGFVKPNGIPMERFALIFLKTEFLFPKKRTFKSINVFKELYISAKKESKPIGFWNKRLYKEDKSAASLEKSVILLNELHKIDNAVKAADDADKEEKGKIKTDLDKIKLLSVSANYHKKDYGYKKLMSNQNKASGKNSNSSSKGKTREQAIAENVKKKRQKNPNYIPTPKERKAIKKHNENLVNSAKALSKKNAAKPSLFGSLLPNNKLKERRRAKFFIPNSTQKTIPYIADYTGGIFEPIKGRFSKMYALKDINYKTSKDEERYLAFNRLGEFYNSFSDDVYLAVIIDNKFVSVEEQERQVLYELRGDKLDVHREEYNRVLKTALAIGRNNMKVTKYFTITIECEEPIEALLRFKKIDQEASEYLKKFKSDAIPLSTEERLSYYHDKFRKGHEGELVIDFEHIMKQGLSTKDYIAPEFFNFGNNYFQIDDEYYRVMYLNNLPKSVSDEFYANLCDNDFATTATIGISPTDRAKSLRLIENQLSGVNTDKLKAERKASAAGTNPGNIRLSIKNSLEQLEELYDDVLNKDQKMFNVNMVFIVHGSSLKELELNCKTFRGKASAITAQMQTLRLQQEEGMKVALPFGYPPDNIGNDRMLTTDSLVAFMPFKNQEIFDPNSVYMGLNQISHNMILLNREKLKTPSGFMLGKSGSGKSFRAKLEMLSVLLSSNTANIFTIDPENEYGDFTRALFGTVLRISSDSPNYINPMDMSEDYGLDENDPLDISIEIKKDKAFKKKSGLIMSLIEQMTAVSGGVVTLTPQQRTIVDDCLRKTYKNFLDNNFNQKLIPTLGDLQNELDEVAKNEPRGVNDAKLVAKAVEYYTRGSMSIFNNKTNVDMNNRMITFNVRDLGDQLKGIALSIVFDFIWNSLVKNKALGIKTYCYADEIHVMFKSELSANFMQNLYKRGRKYGLTVTGITQNVSDLLQSEQARGMITNSEYILMLQQDTEELMLLSTMVDISDALVPYIKGADVGSGLLFAGNVVVPFYDKFPTDSYLYTLISTRFGEDLTEEEISEKVSALVEKSSEKNNASRNLSSDTVKKITSDGVTIELLN